MQLRADDAHFREFAGTGPDVLVVVRLTGTAYSGNPMDKLTPPPFPLYLLW